MLRPGLGLQAPDRKSGHRRARRHDDIPVLVGEPGVDLGCIGQTAPGRVDALDRGHSIEVVDAGEKTGVHLAGTNVIARQEPQNVEAPHVSDDGGTAWTPRGGDVFYDGTGLDEGDQCTLHNSSDVGVDSCVTKVWAVGDANPGEVAWFDFGAHDARQAEGIPFVRAGHHGGHEGRTWA